MRCTLAMTLLRRALALGAVAGLAVLCVPRKWVSKCLRYPNMSQASPEDAESLSTRSNIGDLFY